MGFAGNLRTLSLGEVFQTLGRIQATGVLRLASDAGGRDVVFDQGTIIGVGFRAGDRKQALLKRLILIGKLDGHSAASLSSSGNESQVVKAIVTNGWVSADDVSAAYEQQARDELASLSTWDFADFVFEDAGPDQKLANDLVERYRKSPIAIEMNQVLMESARRADEWQRLRERIPNGNVVFAPLEGADDGMAELAKEYPASAVVSLVDGVRSVDDVVVESVATRLDIYGAIVEMLDQRLVMPLDREQQLVNADHLLSSGGFGRAAHIYRRLLAESPTDGDVAARLAGCLDHLGESAEAAASYAQLALQHVDQKDGARALEYARRAVELAPDKVTERLTLVRCLMLTEQSQAAVQELRTVLDTYLRLGQLEDARGTCLKILAIDKNDEPARRELARIFSRGEKDPAAEDVVVCVQCNHVNHREAAQCAKCSAPLQLTCLACGRVVAVSDQVCIFCGANPHAGRSKSEQPPGNPATSTFVKTDRVTAEAKQGTAHWREKIKTLVETASAHEQAGRIDEALRDWREVAKFQSDSTDIQARIRELEFKANEVFIEKRIEYGHQLRKGRRYWRSTAAYRQALRSMQKDDPRAAPLRQILAATLKSRNKLTGVYAAAAAIFLVIGAMIAKPHLDLHNFRRSVDDLRPDVALVPAQGGDSVPIIAARIKALEARCEALRGAQRRQALLLLLELKGAFELAEQQAAQKDLAAIAGAIERKDLDNASTRIAAFTAAYGVDMLVLPLRQQADRLERMRQDRQQQDLAVKEGPKRLVLAKEREQAGASGEALVLFRSLSSSADAKISVEAKEGVARLEPEEKKFLQACAQAEELVATDLKGADAAFAALVPRSAGWNKKADIEARRRALGEAIDDATSAYRKLTAQSPAADLEAFLAAHPGSAESAQARARLATLHQQQALREQGLTRYRSLMEAKNYEDAWQAAHDVMAAQGGNLRPDEIVYPLVIETSPTGASVSVGGKPVGKTPFVLTYLPKDGSEVVLALDGWKPVSFRLQDMAKDWRKRSALVRIPAWRCEFGKPISEIQPLGDGHALVVAGDVLSLVDHDGRSAWSHPLGIEEPHARHQPTPLPGGGSAIALPDHGVVLLDGSGGVSATRATTTEVRGRPLVFTNEVFGTQPRIAFAAEALYAGQLGGDLQRIPLPAAALAGPIAVAKDLDRVLVVADLRGHLVGVEESTRATAWDVDLQASECGNLVMGAEDTVLMVLDGSRLVAYRITAAGAQVRWTRTLASPAVGDPVLLGSVACIATGSTIARFSLDGAPAPPITLSSPAGTGAACTGEYLAVGCQDGTVHLFRGGEPVWTTPCSGLPTMVRFDGQTLLVGQADGAVQSFAP